MSIAIVTGSAGLIGSEAVRYFAEKGMEVVGVDNDMRRSFFGDEASTRWNRDRLQVDLGARYEHVSLDIRDDDAIESIGLCEQISGLQRFNADYPECRLEYDDAEILQEIFDENVERWTEAAVA